MSQNDLNIYIRLSLLRDKEIISESGFRNRIAGIVIEPHIFELFSNAVSSYLAQSKLRYFIDMSLHRFMMNVYESYSAKPWYDVLKEKLGLPLSEERPYLNPSYIDVKDLRRIARKTLEYQISYVPAKIRNVLGLMNFFGSLGEESHLEPSILVAPYLVIDEPLVLNEEEAPQVEDLLSFNINLLKEFKNTVEKIGIAIPVMGVIALSKEILLDRETTKNIVKQYLDQGPEYLGIWISGLDEYDNSEVNLRLLINNLLNNIRETNSYNNVKIINLYSGFFSLILNRLGFLDGIVHGVLHSETRQFNMVVTGATFRFYVDFLHKALSRTDFLLFFRNKIPEDCGSPVCREFIRRHYLLAKIYSSWKDLAKHFLYVRLVKEKNSLINKDINDIIELINNDLEKAREFSSEGQLWYGHLISWLKILSELREPQ